MPQGTRKRSIYIVAGIALCLSLGGSSSSAGALYIYTGNAFDHFYEKSSGAWPTSGRITATMNFDSELAPNLTGEAPVTPVLWTISDGVHTIDQSVPAVFAIRVATDAQGNIVHWVFAAFAPTADSVMGLDTSSDSSNISDFTILWGADDTATGFAYNSASPGAWTRKTMTESALQKRRPAGQN